MAVTKRPTIQYVRQNIIEERVTGATIPAGNIVEINSSDLFVNSTAAGLNLVAVEDGVQVADETESYASGERCKAYVFTSGEKAYLNLADGETTVIGSGIANNGDGSVKVADSAVAAVLNTGVEGNNNAITWTAQSAGADGNDIKVGLIDPSGNSQPLTVTVYGTYIEVLLATDGGGAITSTPSTIIPAIAASAAASTLVVATNTGESTGASAVVAEAAANLENGADAEVAIGTALEAVSASGSTAKVLTIFN